MQKKKMVKVYSNCDEAELFVNGKSFGKRKRNSQDFPAAGLRWQVAFQVGKNVIKVVAKKGDEVITDEIEQEYQTDKWGKMAKLIIEKITEKDGIATVQVKALDANNVLCLDAMDYVYFDLTGDGKLIDHQGTSDGSRKVQFYNGRAIINVKLNAGKSVVSVKSGSLATEFLNL